MQVADAEVLLDDVSDFEMALLRRISDSVSLAVVEFLRMMPSSIWLRARKSRLGFPA